MAKYIGAIRRHFRGLARDTLLPIGNKAPLLGKGFSQRKTLYCLSRMRAVLL